MKKLPVLTFFITLVIWTIFTWPLPRNINRAIPSSAISPNNNEPRRMVVGDHLQLKYRFWLISDYLKGNSPWGKNVYEFNLNNDEERDQPGAMYMPFSLIYAILALGMSSAAAWNITGLLTLWGTYTFTVLLAGHYTKSKSAVLAFSLVSIWFPLRYHSLLGGSPTGFSMMWPPLLLLGLERLWRYRELRGSLLVSLGLLFACFTDLKIFYLSTLLCGVWSLFLIQQTVEWTHFPSWKFFKPYFRVFSPFVVTGALLLSYIHHINQHILNSAQMSSGRSIEEIAIYSAPPITFFSMAHSGESQGNYLGVTWILVLCVCVAAAIFRKNISPKRSRLLGIALLWGVVFVGLIFLAMGTQGPFKGITYDLAFRAIPKWNMIRQPARVLTLMPPLITLMLCVLVPKVCQGFSSRRVKIIIAVISLCMFAEYYGINETELCILDTENMAYAATVTDHENRQLNGPVRGVALPLWPGDTHWSALYIYYASLYNIRMVNGYSPVTQQAYFEGVFEELRSMNSGVIRESQLDFLLENNINYLFIHEDVFPEIVSPFPVAQTLHQFLKHPRIAFLHHDKRTWSFKILREPQPEAVQNENLKGIYAPSRYFKPASRRQNAALIRDDSSDAGPYIHLDPEQPAYVAKSTVVGGSDVFWLIRARGTGTVTVQFETDNTSFRSPSLTLQKEEWDWYSVSLAPFPDIGVGDVRLILDDGTVDVEQILLSNVEAPIQSSTTFPAIHFFRAGSTELERHAVHFDPERDLRARILYGPRLPFQEGPATVTVRYRSPAPDGADLGTFRIEQPEGTLVQTTSLPAGQESVSVVTSLNGQHPVVFSFEYGREHPMDIFEVIYQPKEP